MSGRVSFGMLSKRCTLEVRRLYYRRDVDHGPWSPTLDTWSRGRPVLWFRSVRQARARLVVALGQHVDYLSRCGYEARLRFADGTTRPIPEARLDFAVERAKWEQQDESIGARLRRGETVVV